MLIKEKLLEYAEDEASSQRSDTTKFPRDATKFPLLMSQTEVRLSSSVLKQTRRRNSNHTRMMMRYYQTRETIFSTADCDLFSPRENSRYSFFLRKKCYNYPTKILAQGLQVICASAQSDAAAFQMVTDMGYAPSAWELAAAS